MTDSTITTNSPVLWLPTDVWAIIVNLLSPNALIAFSLVCKTFYQAVTDDVILQPLYNRLREIDKTLPATLPKEGAVLTFKKAFEKIQARLQEEINYLTKYHPKIMEKPEYTQVLQKNSSEPLELLEDRSTILEKINSEIITTLIIDINSTKLKLQSAHITRLPVTLFQADGYANFWKNLISLDCSGNNLTTLDVQELASLQNLNCSHNKLTKLNVQGLAALQILRCNINQLTALNVQGSVALQLLWCNNNQLTALNVKKLVELKELWCQNNQLATLNLQELTWLVELEIENNPLIDLNLTGVSAAIKSKYAEQEKSLLFKQLIETDCVDSQNIIIARLGKDYAYKNCRNYCSEDVEDKLFPSVHLDQNHDNTLSDLSLSATFLPSSSSASNNPPVNSRKRLLDEKEEQELSENQIKQEKTLSTDQEKQQNNEPDAKRRKKS